MEATQEPTSPAPDAGFGPIGLFLIKTVIVSAAIVLSAWILLDVLKPDDANLFGVRGLRLHDQRELHHRARRQAIEIAALADRERHGHRLHEAGDGLNRSGEGVAGAIDLQDHAGHRIFLCPDSRLDRQHQQQARHEQPH